MPFDKSKFIEKFKTETREHLQKLNLGFLRLEKTPKDKELLNTLMREAHTIKGAATMMGYHRISEIAHKMEDGLEKATKKTIVIDKEGFDLLFKTLDLIESLLEDKVTWRDKGLEEDTVKRLCDDLVNIFAGKGRKSSAKDASRKKKTAKKPKESPLKTGTAEDSLRVDIEKLDRLVNISGELIISKIRLRELVTNILNKTEQREFADSFPEDYIRDLRDVNDKIDFLTSDMQAEIVKVRMIPVAYLFNAFPRAMRDLAQEKQKDIDFQIKGEDTSLDKAILDEIKSPIMHLLRNSVDHGIETKEERKNANKPETGRIELKAYQQGSQIMIEISDDGRGIDVNKVKEKAVKKGIVSSDRIKDMPDEQIYQLLFTSGFTTKEEVSDISGRGVGLDVVRESIAKLKGLVEVYSGQGQGTRIVMRLPLTLAITESLLIAAGSDVFAIPIDSVVETVRVASKDIKKVETKEAVTMRGQILPLLRLNDLFGLPRKGIIEKNFLPVVIVQSVEKRIAILIDELLGRQEIISKSLGDPLKNMKNISGATILGSGRVVLILDVPSIIESSEGVIVKKSSVMPKVLPRSKKKRTILLAEDVLSTAMLEKNVLESVGYSVVIARDGKEALERASQEVFDLVITDVLMPRMDGFELTASLRKDKVYKETPIIIVTTRESDSDKRRGLESGANAYILKSEFTSEGLLDTIERLLG